MEKRCLSTNLMIGCLFALTSCLALTLPGANAGTVYFADDFEHGLGKWTVGGDAWKIIDSVWHSTSHSASYGPYAANVNAAMTMKIPIDLSQSSKPVLTFWHKIGIRGSDYGYVEISEKKGSTSTWKLVDPNYSHPSYFTGTDNSTWSQEQYDLSAYKSSSILIRFRLEANGSSESWGWDIDDVELCELDPITIAFPFFDGFESGLGNWIIPGDSWQLTECTCPCGTHVGHPSDPCDCPGHSVADSNYPAYAYSCLTLAHPIDLSSSASPVLTFWHKIGIQGSDYGYVEISKDKGFTWKLVDPNYSHPSYFTGTHRSTWSQEQYDLSAYKSSSILIRFRLEANGSSQSWGWTIDDVELCELDTTTLPFPFFDDFENGIGNWITPCDSWRLTETDGRRQTDVAETDSRSWTHSMTDSNYPAYAYSCLTLAHPIDLSSSASPVLTFWHKIGIQGSDYGYVEISKDKGFTWKLVDPNYSHPSYFTGTHRSNWFQEQYDLSAYKSSSILIRFRLEANGSSQSWGWDIDDVEIRELFYPADPLIVQITGIDNSNCPTVQATVIVTDKDGVALTALGASSFSVYEDGIARRPITLSPGTLPICVSLALDCSGSMGDNAIKESQTAADGFVDCMVPEDGGQVIKFANGIEIMQPYTHDKSALKDAIGRPTTVQSSATSLYDAIYQGIIDTSGYCCQGSDSTGRTCPCNKAVVAITDGLDNKSEHSATGIIAEAKARGVRIFTVGLGAQVDEDILKAIAGQTGGVYYPAPTASDLQGIYLAIAGTLKNQYVVTYQSVTCESNGNTDVEHELTIAITANAGYGQDTERFHCPLECKP